MNPNTSVLNYLAAKKLLGIYAKVTQKSFLKALKDHPKRTPEWVFRNMTGVGDIDTCVLCNSVSVRKLEPDCSKCIHGPAKEGQVYPCINQETYLGDCLSRAFSETQEEYIRRVIEKVRERQAFITGLIAAELKL